MSFTHVRMSVFDKKNAYQHYAESLHKPNSVEGFAWRCLCCRVAAIALEPSSVGSWSLGYGLFVVSVVLIAALGKDSFYAYK